MQLNSALRKVARSISWWNLPKAFYMGNGFYCDLAFVCACLSLPHFECASMWSFLLQTLLEVYCLNGLGRMQNWRWILPFNFDDTQMNGLGQEWVQFLFVYVCWVSFLVIFFVGLRWMVAFQAEWEKRYSTLLIIWGSHIRCFPICLNASIKKNHGQL